MDAAQQRRNEINIRVHTLAAQRLQQQRARRNQRAGLP